MVPTPERTRPVTQALNCTSKCAYSYPVLSNLQLLNDPLTKDLSAAIRSRCHSSWQLLVVESKHRELPLAFQECPCHVAHFHDVYVVLTRSRQSHHSSFYYFASHVRSLRFGMFFLFGACVLLGAICALVGISEAASSVLDIAGEKPPPFHSVCDLCLWGKRVD